MSSSNSNVAPGSIRTELPLKGCSIRSIAYSTADYIRHLDVHMDLDIATDADYWMLHNNASYGKLQPLDDAKAERSAITIQRAWRAKWARMVAEHNKGMEQYADAMDAKVDAEVDEFYRSLNAAELARLEYSDTDARTMYPLDGASVDALTRPGTFPMDVYYHEMTKPVRGDYLPTPRWLSTVAPGSNSVTEHLDEYVREYQFLDTEYQFLDTERLLEMTDEERARWVPDDVGSLYPRILRRPSA